MAIIGFAVLIVAGLVCLWVGFWANRISLGFTGRLSFGGIFVFLVGVGLIAVAIYFAPFQIMVLR